MRCTSTPMTPEPSCWRAKAAIAMRARSRIAASFPWRRAAAICARSASSSSSENCAIPPASSSRTPSLAAATSTARKKKRSNTSSKMRRSSWLLASVAASASRKSSCVLQLISPSTANASSSSEVPTATPSRRSSSPSSRMRAGRPSADIGRRRELEPHALGHNVHVGAVLDDHRHRLRKRVRIDFLRSEEQQRACPVDRLGDRRGLLQVELSDHPDHLHKAARDRLLELRGVQAHDLKLVLQRGVVEPQVQAAPLQRLRQLARVVRGQEHDRVRLRAHRTELGDRDLKVRENLKQHGLELLIGLVD